MKKRFLPLILALILTMGLMTVPAAAAFTDVPSNAWYAQDVADVQRFGIIEGMGNGKFAPLGTLTLAQAITMAARTYAWSHGDSLSSTGGSLWYEPYVQYADTNGICLTGEFGTSYNGTCSRRTMALLFARVIPEGTKTPLNKVPSLPDVPDTDANRPIYTLYELGILTGNDDRGTFAPERTITRAEVAAILNRLLDTGKRKTLPFGTSAGTNQTQTSSTPVTPTTPVTPILPGSSGMTAAEIETRLNDRFQSAFDHYGHYKGRPERNSELDQAARLLAQGTESSPEAALQSIGFNKPVGTKELDRYTVQEYPVKATIKTFPANVTDNELRSLTPEWDLILLQFQFRSDGWNLTDWFAWDSYGLAVEPSANGFRCVILSYNGSLPVHTIYDEKNYSSPEAQVADLQKHRNGGVTIKVDGISDASQAQELRTWADAYIESLPQSVIDEYNKRGWTFYIAEPTVYETKYAADKPSSSGITVTGDNYIAVRSTSVLKSSETILHEFGHFVDHTFLPGIVGKYYYDNYKQSVIDATGSYAGTNQSECFAEAFQKYYRFPNRLKEMAPEYYDLIKTVLAYAENPPAQSDLRRNERLESELFGTIYTALRPNGMPEGVPRDTILDTAAARIAANGRKDFQAALDAAGYVPPEPYVENGKNRGAVLQHFYLDLSFYPESDLPQAMAQTLKNAADSYGFSFDGAKAIGFGIVSSGSVRYCDILVQCDTEVFVPYHAPD